MLAVKALEEELAVAVAAKAIESLVEGVVEARSVAEDFAKAIVVQVEP